MRDRDRGYEIAYQEALRAITDQQGVLDSIQSRIGILASASALILSLTAQRTLGPAGVTSSLLVSLCAFLVVAALTVYVLWPRRNWRFHFGVDRLHAEYVENAEPLSAGLMTRDLAIHLDAYFRSNARTIDRISLGFAGTLFFLIVEAAAFSYDVVGGQ